MNLFSFKNISALSSITVVAATMFASTIQAGELDAYRTVISMGKEACLRGYDTLTAKRLWDGGCYGNHSSYQQCARSVATWTGLQEVTDRHCLQIFGSLALNSRGADFNFLGGHTFREYQEQYAYRLSRNELYMETLARLDQAEMKKISARVTRAWK